MNATLVERQQAASAVRLELDALGFTPKTTKPLSDVEVHAFYHINHNNPTKAAQAIIDSERWHADQQPVSIKDVAAFFRAPPGCTYPPSCQFVLEDGKGDCARDKQGRPILVSLGGLPHGTLTEMILQLRYARQRVSQYTRDGDPPGACCAVVEALPRVKGEAIAFRFPEGDTRVMFDIDKRYYPGSQFVDLHICGLNRIVIGSFHLCKVFMNKEVYENMHLKPSFAHLKDFISDENRLSVWDKNGTFQFDLDKYVEWRAKEEGIPIEEVCPRGLGRTYSAASSSMLLSTAALLSNEEARHAAHVIKYGTGYKRGSGVGLFSSTRWKAKLLVVIPTTLVYFDSDKINEANKASRMIALDPNCTVSFLESDNSKSSSSHAAVLRVHASGRDFDFGFDSKKEAMEWKLSIRKAFYPAGSL